MISQEKVLNLVKLFGMTNLLAEDQLELVARELNLDLRPKRLGDNEKDSVYYPQFDESIRREAAMMAQHYEVFYCLEKSIRTIVRDKLNDKEGAGWWEKTVPEQIKAEIGKRMRTEVESGFTARSSDPLDYTTFGELGEVIKSNWLVFGDTFSDQKAVSKVMNNLNVLRGPIAHCCPLAEDEVLRLQLSLRDWYRLME